MMKATLEKVLFYTVTTKTGYPVLFFLVSKMLVKCLVSNANQISQIVKI